jgi:ParB-like chromosome segregation protein Spo0J
MSQIALGFIPEPLLVPFDKLLPSRKLPENINGTKKYRQIVESLRSIGLIEPLTISPSTEGGLHISA